MTTERLYIRPGKLILYLFLVIAFTGMLSAITLHYFSHGEIAAEVQQYLMAAVYALLLLAMVDYVLARKPLLITIDRQIRNNIAVNQWTNMTLDIRHDYRQNKIVELCDLYSAAVEFNQAKTTLTLQTGKISTFKNKLRALQRGELILPGVHIRVHSPMFFWQSVFQIDHPIKIKVYPDFNAIAGYTLLATDNHTSMLGIRKKPRRGEGLDFLQLREYRAGDTMRQIDWKATSRRQQLVSKEYRDERDQQIVLLLDSGRRMRAKDDTLSHFDHALNAALLLSYIALHQGDAVSALSFGNIKRWISARKGVANINTILNNLYDLHSGIKASDYLDAAKEVLSRQRKRSLIILITNTRDEEVDELVACINLMRKHHLVLLANIRECALDQALHEPINNFETALRYTSVVNHMQQRKNAAEKIQAQGIQTIDCEPQQLAIEVANRYLAIKRAGSL